MAEKRPAPKKSSCGSERTFQHGPESGGAVQTSAHNASMAAVSAPGVNIPRDTFTLFGYPWYYFAGAYLSYRVAKRMQWL